MPLYEYRCDACGYVFEVIQKFSDEPLETHEGCGGRVERLLSAPALQFKGTGWYVTDYAHKNGTNGSSGHHGRGNGSNSESKSETKSESKSESKSEAKSDSAGKDSGKSAASASKDNK